MGYSNEGRTTMELYNRNTTLVLSYWWDGCSHGMRWCPTVVGLQRNFFHLLTRDSI